MKNQNLVGSPGKARHTHKQREGVTERERKRGRERQGELGRQEGHPSLYFLRELGLLTPSGARSLIAHS